MLNFYDDDYELYTDNPLRTVHNGKPGGADERLIFIRNDDSSKYYTNLVATVQSTGDFGEFSSTGWSVKFLYGARQPTESEWDTVVSVSSLDLPDIGDTDAADTYTYHPIWVRVYCPGEAPAQIRESQALRVSYRETPVGS